MYVLFSYALSGVKDEWWKEKMQCQDDSWEAGTNEGSGQGEE
jgi:hypothetical protein